MKIPFLEFVDDNNTEENISNDNTPFTEEEIRKLDRKVKNMDRIGLFILVVVILICLGYYLIVK